MIEDAFCKSCTTPDFFADVARQSFGLKPVEWLGEKIVLKHTQNIAITDATESQIKLFCVDGLNRYARLARAGEDIAAPWKAHFWRSVAHVEFNFCFFDKAFATFGRKTGAEG